jgi:histidinol-phosphatase (PHP family)
MLDLHIHSSDFSSDAVSPSKSIMEACVERGIKRMAFTEHVDLNDSDYYSGEEDGLFDIGLYLDNISALRKKYKNIEIIAGIEAGFNKLTQHYTSEVINNFPEIEYVINSVHDIYEIPCHKSVFFSGKSEEQAYSEYLEYVYESLDADYYYSSLGHLGYLSRYTASKNPMDYAAHREITDKILKKLIDKGKALELNTGVRSVPLPFLVPTAVLKRYKELGGEYLTYGSDSHSVQTLGFNYEKTVEIIKDTGFKYLTIFRERKPIQIKI